MDFGQALKELLKNCRVQRRSWKNGWIQLQTPDHNSKMTRPYIYFENMDSVLVPWSPTHSDILADDWQVTSY